MLFSKRLKLFCCPNVASRLKSPGGNKFYSGELGSGPFSVICVNDLGGSEKYSSLGRLEGCLEIFSENVR